MIGTEPLNKILDKTTSAYLRALGTSGSGYGTGLSTDTFGAADAIDDIKSFIQETGDLTVQTELGSGALRLESAYTVTELTKNSMRGWIATLDSHIRRAGSANYSNTESLLRYLNVTDSTKWQALQHPRWRDLYYAVRNSYPEEYNVYFEVLQGGSFDGTTFTNGLRRLLVGTGETAGFTSMDPTKYCGGIPALVVTNFAGTSGTVTVTGTFYNPATQTTASGVTATFTVGGNGRFYRVGGTAATDALIVSCSAISAAGSITASTNIYVEAERPALRSGTCGADTVTSTTVGLDDNASSINDFYIGYEIATNADNYTKRTITAYNGTTKVATVGSAWATNPTASTSLFRIYRPQLPF